MDIDFSIPTRIIMEVDALVNHMPKLKAYGNQAFLLASEDLDRKGPIFHELVTLLKDYDIKTISYEYASGIPTADDIEAGAAFAREAAVDFVLAMGDAAVIDRAKAIALLAAADIGQQTLIASPGQKALPLVAIPTRAECSGAANGELFVRHRHEDGDRITQVVNPRLAPALTLLDASYSLDVSNEETLGHCLQIIAQAVDALISEDANPLTDALVLSALGMIVDYPEKMISEETMSLYEREDGMLASIQVGIAMQQGSGLVSLLATALKMLRPLSLGYCYGLAMHALLPVIEEQALFAAEILLNAFDADDMADFSSMIQAFLPLFPPLTQAEHTQVLNQIMNQENGSILRLSEEELSRLLAGIGI